MSNANVTVEAVENMIARTRNGSNDNTKGNTFDAKNYLDTRLKPGETSRKVKVRILPVSADDNNFALEVKTHSLKLDKKIAESGFKSFICLDDTKIPNYDTKNKCPLCSKAYELFKQAKALKNDGKENMAQPLYDRAKQLMNKSTYFVRVIDRSLENEGVKFWRFNKSFKGEGIMDKLIDLYDNKKDAYKEKDPNSNYNIFDLNNGRDIILTIKRAYDKQGKELPNAISIDASDSESPLTTDMELFDKWINDPKKWYNAYTIRTNDYLSIIADGEIPVKNSEGKWVSESLRNEEMSAKEQEAKEIAEESEKILAQENIKPTSTMKATVEYDVEDDDDDLPF